MEPAIIAKTEKKYACLSLGIICKEIGSIFKLNFFATNFSILGSTLAKAFALKDQLVFVDVYVDQSEHVYPMLVSPNGSMKDMWLSRGKKT